MEINRKTLNNLVITGALFFIFTIYTLIVKFVDVEAVGPLNSKVGLAGLNKNIHENWGSYSIFNTITEILALLVIAVAGFIICLAIIQACKNKSIKNVSREYKILAIIYVLMACCYLFFEFVIINYRPVLEDGELAASYPSSHVLLTLVILGTASIILMRQNCKKWIKYSLLSGTGICMVISVIGRLLAGVHWLTDVIGGVLLSAFLIMLYYSCLNFGFAKSEFDERSGEIEVDQDPSAMQDIVQDVESV